MTIGHCPHCGGHRVTMPVRENMSNLDETMKRAAQLLETFVVTEATTRLQTLLDSYPWTLQTVLAPGGIDEHTPPASAVAADIAIVLAALAEAQRELSRL